MVDITPSTHTGPTEHTHFLGVDVALRRLDFCLLERRPAGEGPRWRLALLPGKTSSAEGILEAIAPLAPPACTVAGIDAPLWLPAEGIWRECDRGLRRLGIPCYAPLGRNFAAVTHFGIATAERLQEAGATCLETYPYASRVRLDLAPRLKKHTPEGRQALREALAHHVALDGLPADAPHDALDAIVAALTAALYAEGLTEGVAGPDGIVTLPRARAG